MDSISENMAITRQRWCWGKRLDKIWTLLLDTLEDIHKEAIKLNCNIKTVTNLKTIMLFRRSDWYNENYTQNKKW
jgi:hypothetical protein